ncbi:MAG TPA: Hsp20/alpha crystallin family protein [Gemmatimonadota bacterium]|jgi:HSP20 family protein|nr:Hsp20/alpha crystallin family protein [Gemmatimonadota bacterium]
MNDKTREKTPVEELLADIDSYIHDWFQAKLPFTFQGGVRWTPPTDVFETEDAVHVTMAIPGTRPEDMSVHFEHDTLLVRGVRRERCGDSRRYLKMEIPVGAFSRRLRIARPVNADGIKVAYTEGMLRVTLPKVHPRVDVPIA